MAIEYYNYTVYNQRIRSEIPIRALKQEQDSSACYDVKVSLGKTPARLKREPILKNVCTEIAKNEFLLFHKDLGVRIYVKNGNEVVVDKDYCEDPDVVSLYFVGSVMGAILYMRNLIPVHASAILTERGVVLFTGVSGCGKSTLAFALRCRGYRPLTDDVAPVNIFDHRAYVYPGYTQFKLWQDALAFNGLSKDDYPKIRDAFSKYYVEFDEIPEYIPYPLYKIYHLAVHNKDELLTIEKTDSVDRLGIVKRNMYRPPYAKGLKKERPFFHTIVNLAHLPMSTITRPRHSLNFEAYVDQVEKDMLT